MEAESATPASRAIQERFDQDVMPALLPVLSGTWLSPKMMGLDLDAGMYLFIDEGTHIWESFFRYWGWWKTIVLGWYPYTDLRDVHSHMRQGFGRPWLRALPEHWQELVFRELVLLIGEWNSLVDEEHQIVYSQDKTLPMWVSRWLSLTNASWRQGAIDLEREIYEATSSQEVADLTARVTHLVERYLASEQSWRPIMPEIAVYHQRYGDRPAYWTFERVV